MTYHPGRLACLTRAAYDNIPTPERLNLIRLGAPGRDPEDVLRVLKQVADRAARTGDEAEAMLAGLVEDPPQDTEKDV